MKTVIIVGPDGSCGPTRWMPTTEALKRCFAVRGWKIKETTRKIEEPADLIAGYGWRPQMREAWERWPEIVLHADLGFWSREGEGYYMKLALGGRWSPLADYDYDDTRLRKHKVQIAPSRAPGRRVLVCGMSAKAAGTWGLEPEQWERKAVKRLLAAGAKVTYRPKPSWHAALPIAGADFDRGEIWQTLARVHAVVSHHSNTAIDALVAGLPIYVETGIARALSVPTLLDILGAEALDIETRARFLRQVAHHQYTLAELAEGAWLRHPEPITLMPSFKNIFGEA